MNRASTPRPPDSLIVRILTWVALPFVLTWMTLKSFIAGWRRLGARLVAVLRAAAQALAAVARRVGDAIRLTLATLGAGLRRLGARLLVLARASAQLVARPFRVAFGALRRLGARLVGRTAVLSLDILGLGAVVVVLAYESTRGPVHLVASRVAAVTDLTASAARAVLRVTRAVAATTWMDILGVLGRARHAIIATLAWAWRPIRSGIVRAARAAGRLATSAWSLMSDVVSRAATAIRLAFGAARRWCGNVVRGTWTAVARVLAPIARAVLLPVGALVRVAIKAMSRARALAASLGRVLATATRRAVQRIRVTTSGLWIAARQSIRRAATAVRRTSDSVRLAVGRATAALRLAARQAKRSVATAASAARQSAHDIVVHARRRS